MQILRTWWTAVLSSTTAVLKQYHVKASFQDKFLEAMRVYIFSSISARGNIMAAAYYEKGDSNTMWIIERWGNRTSYRYNSKTAAAKLISNLSKTGLAAPVETIFIKDLEFFSKKMWRMAPKAHDQPITVMLFVDVKPGTEHHFLSLNQRAMSAFRNEPGGLIFQFSQLLSHKTRFIVFKQFSNWDAFQYHIKDPAQAPVIKFLQTFIKEPPFERGYHRLIQFAPLYLDA